MTTFDYSNIKLIIWDLDETLWSGILSDGTAVIPKNNIELLHNIVDSGTMCSICSKNDEFQVNSFLDKFEIRDLFVFTSINWTAKGDRVKQIIQDMGLREINVLFIDDNYSNLAEVKCSCPNINVCSIDAFDSIHNYYATCEKKDLGHSRLKQYRVLERKVMFKAKSGSNEDFLRDSNIRVDIKYDCENHIDRIGDLVLRSNQLNFTKIRDSIENLTTLIKDKSVNTGYVEVEDNYGEYGIVGFFAIKNNTCIHFVFSCRILNMGVEQYVYHVLGKPLLTINGEVSSDVNGIAPTWINQKNTSLQEFQKSNLSEKKVVLKGPCDMQQIFSYINKNPNIITEFSFVNEKGINVENGNHSTMILQCLTISDSIKERLIQILPFADKHIFQTSIFNDDIDTVVFSLFMESHLGLYKEKESDAIVAFGEYTNDLTDPDNWKGLIDGSLYNANCRFTHELLASIKERFDFIGRISPKDSFENIKRIYRELNGKRLILNCGSEIPFLGVCHEVNRDKHKYNQELNSLLKEWIGTVNNVYLIDVNDYIHGQEDFVDSVTHFRKRIYYDMSGRLVEIFSENPNNINIDQSGKFVSDMRHFLSKITNKIKGK